MLERAGFEVVATAGDAVDLMRKTRAEQPDVMVTDIRMPPQRSDDGLRVAIEIRRTDPEIGVLVLSQFLEDRFVHELVGDRADGVGYLLKEKVADSAVLAHSLRHRPPRPAALRPHLIPAPV